MSRREVAKLDSTSPIVEEVRRRDMDELEVQINKHWNGPIPCNTCIKARIKAKRFCPWAQRRIDKMIALSMRPNEVIGGVVLDEERSQEISTASRP